MIKAALLLLVMAVGALGADLTGRWTAGGKEVFVLNQEGSALTGTIVGKPGTRTYKIADGVIRGNQVHSFVFTRC